MLPDDPFEKPVGSDVGVNCGDAVIGETWKLAMLLAKGLTGAWP